MTKTSEGQVFTARNNCIRAARRELGRLAQVGEHFDVLEQSGNEMGFTWKRLEEPGKSTVPTDFDLKPQPAPLGIVEYLKDSAPDDDGIPAFLKRDRKERKPKKESGDTFITGAGHEITPEPGQLVQVDLDASVAPRVVDDFAEAQAAVNEMRAERDAEREEAQEALNERRSERVNRREEMLQIVADLSAITSGLLHGGKVSLAASDLKEITKQLQAMIPAEREKKPRGGSKTEICAELMTRPGGCTAQDVLDATGWPTVSMPQQARAAGLELTIEKSNRPYRYFGKR